MTECRHEHTTKMWFEESYGFMGFMITQCVDCGCRIDAQWHQSDDYGEHWHKIDDPMEDIK